MSEATCDQCKKPLSGRPFTVRYRQVLETIVDEPSVARARVGKQEIRREKVFLHMPFGTEHWQIFPSVRRNAQGDVIETGQEVSYFLPDPPASSCLGKWETTERERREKILKGREEEVAIEFEEGDS